MSSGLQTQRILSMPLQQETDVVLCRNRARLVAEVLRFERSDQVRIATAVSEIARNAFRYAREGKAEFYLITDHTGTVATQSMLVTVIDRGDGIADLPSIQAGTYRSKTGMGAGLRGAKRLLDQVDIETGATGTTIRLYQRLPRSRFAGTEELRRLAEELTRTATANPLEELAVQNRELVASMEEITQQRTALAEVNEELKETNRGVVALYDELETVHRVGRVVASRLDLDSLLEAITEATTELSGSEFGAFYQASPGDGRLVCQCVLGPRAFDRERLPSVPLEDLSGRSGEDVSRYESAEAEQLCVRMGLPTTPCLLLCPVRDSGGELMGTLVYGHSEPQMFTERTERILSTVAVQASVGIANARLYRNVQTANDAKARFLAVLSHELRTPLNPVFALLTSFEEHPQLPPDLREDLHVMRRNLQLEARLIDDLLDLTRISEGKLPLRMGAVDLHVLLAAVVQTCESETAKKNIRVHLRLEAPTHVAQGDAARLQQVFWNLLSNAVKFSPEGGTVSISTKAASAGHISVSVTDEGMGIDPAALDRVFQPFEQESKSVSARFGGLGLGLAISRGILAAHHGQIRAESEGFNRGATFVALLPAATAPAATPVASEAGAIGTPSALRILLVDDHDDTRLITGRMLTRRGHVVETAASVREALAKYEAGTFDVVVSDLGLPDGSGHDLMQKIRKFRPVPGIALSGYGMESDVARSLEVGFVKHLTKPIDFTVLDRAISEIAGK